MRKAPKATSNRIMKYKDALLYTIPGSKGARKNSLFYLTVKIDGKRAGLVGQLLVGLQGGNFRAFINGNEKSYNKNPLRYDPTPTSFTILMEGENILVLEVKKTNKKKEDVKIAVNICDLDGDRLNDISFDPESKYL